MTEAEFIKIKKKYPPGTKLRVKQGVSIKLNGQINDLSGKIVTVSYIMKNDYAIDNVYKFEVWVRTTDCDYNLHELEEIKIIQNVEDQITEIEKTWVRCLVPRVSLGQVDEMQLVRSVED